MNKKLYYYDDEGNKQKGANPNLRGDCPDLFGDCTGIKGDCTGLYGDCSGMNIDFNLYKITTKKRQDGINIKVFNMQKRKNIKTNLEKIMDEILQEYLRASKKFKPMASPHEGYAIIKEELDELWDEIKINSDPLGNMRNEAIQVAAMGMRFIIDCCSKENELINL